MCLEDHWASLDTMSIISKYKTIDRDDEDAHYVYDMCSFILKENTSLKNVKSKSIITDFEGNVKQIGKMVDPKIVSMHPILPIVALGNQRGNIQTFPLTTLY